MRSIQRVDTNRCWLFAILSTFVLLAAACGGSGHDGGTGSVEGLGDDATDANPDSDSGTDSESDSETMPVPGESASGESGTVAVACERDGSHASAARPAGQIAAFFALCDAEDGALRPIFRPDPGYDSSPSTRLEQRVDALVGGSSAEERAAGLSTGFDQVEIPQIDVVAAVDGSGTAKVEFFVNREPWNPGPLASSSAQLGSFLDPLLATAFADSEVSGVDLDGLCWGEMGCDAGVTTRALWATTLFTNFGVLSHAYCDLLEAWLRPNDCTLAGQLTKPTVIARVVDVADDDTLNLRSGPGVDFPVLAEVAPDGEVEVTDAAAMADDGGNWRLVADSAGGGGLDGGAGWTNAAFLSLTRTESETLVDLFVTFATDPGNETFDDLPLADEVDLGLGPDLLSNVPSDDLRRAGSWQLDAEEFRAYGGPFSALEALDSLGLYEVASGAHPHCAAEPVPAPSGHDDANRVSVQPRDDVITSCLEWLSVDFFLDDGGNVEAITLDVWEP